MKNKTSRRGRTRCPSCSAQGSVEMRLASMLNPIHELKIWPEFFHAIASGEKKFEIRRDDRGFKVGHVLKLREWDPKTGEYTGDWMLMRVTYIARGPAWGLPQDMVVMSLMP